MPFYPFMRGAGGGKGMTLLGRIPVPKDFTGAKKTKSLLDFIYGREVKRRKITTPAASLLTLGSSFGSIDSVAISSTTTNTLRGRLYHPNQAYSQAFPNRSNKVVLFCSGSGGSAEDYGQPVADYYATQGVRCLTVNYRGFGESGSKFNPADNKGGTPSESGLYDDAYYMYQYLKKRGYQVGNIIVHGFSLGGPVAASLVQTLAQKGLSCRGLVLESPMVSSYEAAADGAQQAINGQQAMVARHLFGPFDTRAKLRAIRAINPNLPLRLTSGDYSKGDQLDIATKLCNPANLTSFLQDVQNMNFTNFQHARDPNADHMDSALHMAAINHHMQALF